MYPCDQASEHDQVEKLEGYEIKRPLTHIVEGVEEVEEEDYDGREQVGREADEVANGVTCAHEGVEHRENLIQLLGAHSLQEFSVPMRHSEDKAHWDGKDPYCGRQ